MSISKILAGAASVAVVSVVMTGAALADFGGMVTVKLSDPAGGEPWRVHRQLLRSFQNMEECERLKESFIGFHVGQVQGYGLMAPSGQDPIIEIESIECFDRSN